MLRRLARTGGTVEVAWREREDLMQRRLQPAAREYDSNVTLFDMI